MHITKIELTGQISPKLGRPIATATLWPNHTGELLMVTIDAGSPLIPDIREHAVETDNPDDLFSMAECLHFHLEGYKGSNSEIHDYYRLLQYFEEQ